MKTLTAIQYALFYAGSNIGHTAYYNGIRIVEFTTARKYFKITLSNGVMRTMHAGDTLQVRNTNQFIIQ